MATSQEVSQISTTIPPNDYSEDLMEQDDSEYFISSSEAESSALDTDEDSIIRSPPDLSLSDPASGNATNTFATSENSKTKKNSTFSIALPENVKSKKNVTIENTNQKKNISMAEHLQANRHNSRGTSVTLSDYKYVKQEYTLRFTAQQRIKYERQLKVLGQLMSSNEITHHLADLPESDLSLKLELVNSNDLSTKELSQGILQYVDSLMTEVKEDLFHAKTLTTQSADEAKEYLDSREHVNEPKVRLAQEEHLLSTVSDDLNLLTTAASRYVALAAAKQHRIVGGKVFFPNLKINDEAQRLLCDLFDDDIPFQIYTNPQETVDYLRGILTSQDLSYNDQDDKIFRLRHPQATQTKVIAVQIDYYPHKNSRKYFQRSFLHHSDEILKWKVRALTPQRETALALIHLGQSKVPPKHVSKDIWLQNQEFLVPSLYSIFSSSSAKSHLCYEKALADGYTGPDPARHIAHLKQQHDIHLQHATARPLRQPAYDNVGMECTIQYAEQFCPVCRETEHGLDDCKDERKGCKICQGQRHSTFQCRKRCACPSARHLRGSPDCPLSIIPQIPQSPPPANSSEGFTLVTKRGLKRLRVVMAEANRNMDNPSSSTIPSNPFSALNNLPEEAELDESQSVEVPHVEPLNPPETGLELDSQSPLGECIDQSDVHQEASMDTSESPEPSPIPKNTNHAEPSIDIESNFTLDSQPSSEDPAAESKAPLVVPSGTPQSNDPSNVLTTPILSRKDRNQTLGLVFKRRSSRLAGKSVTNQPYAKPKSVTITKATSGPLPRHHPHKEARSSSGFQDQNQPVPFMDTVLDDAHHEVLPLLRQDPPDADAAMEPPGPDPLRPPVLVPPSTMNNSLQPSTTTSNIATSTEISSSQDTLERPQNWAEFDPPDLSENSS